MRRSSSTRRRCGASSGSAHEFELAGAHGHTSLSCANAGPIGARNEPQQAVALLGIDHGGEKLAGHLVGVRPQFGQRPRDARGLQTGKLHRQGLALRRDEQQALAPVVCALALQDVALVDELLEHAAERLLGDLQDVEQFGDLHAGIAIDEMQHPVVRPPEAEFLQHIVGIADEVAIGEKQQLDDVPDRLIAAHGLRSPPAGGRSDATGTVRSAILTYFGQIVILITIAAKGTCANRPPEWIAPAAQARSHGRRNIPGVGPGRKSVPCAARTRRYEA